MDASAMSIGRVLTPTENMTNRWSRRRAFASASQSRLASLRMDAKTPLWGGGAGEWMLKG